MASFLLLTAVLTRLSSPVTSADRPVRGIRGTRPIITRSIRQIDDYWASFPTRRIRSVFSAGIFQISSRRRVKRSQECRSVTSTGTNVGLSRDSAMCICSDTNGAIKQQSRRGKRSRVSSRATNTSNAIVSIERTVSGRTGPLGTKKSKRI